MVDLSNPIAALEVSPARRYFGAAVQVGLGILLVYLGLTMPDGSLAARLVLPALGLLVLFQARNYFRATEPALILTEKGLFESTGDCLVALDNIEKVQRGFFELKPSNGFLIRAKKPLPRTWRPGLWWRFGTRIGVGGATSGKAARDMADLIALLLTEEGEKIIAQARAED